jgi:DNA-binding LytR/AlgR family response regulator
LRVVDDAQPALDELSWLLGRDDRVATVLVAGSATEALRVLHEQQVDVVLADVEMPGLSGLELAQVLSRFREPPRVVFVTAHTEHAIEAFDLQAVDYLLKPVREERLREAVRRVLDTAPAPAEDRIAVELGGVTRVVERSDVRYVEAHGDYARLHTSGGSHLVRMPLSVLEDRWRDAGFVRIHRSVMVALRHVDEVRTTDGRCTVVVEGRELQVSRRLTANLRDQLRHMRGGGQQ